jgi:photosystem II stability/assembly factor-like uncharacterized protein
MKRLLTVFFLIYSSTLFGQWVQTGGPSAGPSSMAFNSKGDIFDLNGYLIRSTDNGNSWQDISPPFFGLGTISWGISHDNIYFLLSDGSFFRSTNNGSSWEQTFKTPIQEFQLYLSKTWTLYLLHSAGNGFQHILLRSLDDGVTWNDISNGLPNYTEPYTFFSITPTGELFLQGYQRNVYYSLDKGNSWTMESTLPYRLQTGILGTSNGYIFCGNAIYDSVKYVQTSMVIRSTDNGKTWDSIGNSAATLVASNDTIGFTSSYSYDFIFSKDYGTTWKTSPLLQVFRITNDTSYPDHFGNIYWSTEDITIKFNIYSGTATEFSIPIGKVDKLLIDRNENIIATGNAFISVSKNKGKSWVTNPNAEGLFTQGGKVIGFDSTGRVIVIFGDNAFSRSSNLGMSWDEFFLPVSTNGWRQILTAPDGNIFVLGVNVIIYSTDTGKTWANATAPSSISYPGIDVDKSSTLYSFTNQHILRSIDTAHSWQILLDISTLLSGTLSTITSLVVKPQGEIYVGTSLDGIIRSLDLGAHWEVANANLGSAHISALFAAPDGGVTAFSKGGNLHDGIIYRPHNGSKWFSQNAGLRYTDNLTTMAFAPDGTAYLGTNGEGVWRSQGFSAVNEAKENNIQLSISPNPASNMIEVTYSLRKTEYIILDLCDLLGRTLLKISEGNQDAGEHSMNAGLHTLPAGMYFIRLMTSEGSQTQKIIIAK